MKEKMLKVSVVISVFNGVKYLPMQLDSIRNQIMKPDEVLLFDDKSTDGSVKFIREYINQHHLEHSWYLYLNSVNKGWRKNFKDGILRAKGKYIFLCDQDDIWRFDKLKRMYDAMESHPQINLLVSKYIEFTKSIKKEQLNIKINKKIYYVKWSKKFMRILFPGCTYCIRASFLAQIKKYWKDEYAHDAFLWRMALCADSVAVYNAPLMAWRKYPQSTNSKEKKEDRNKIFFRLKGINNTIDMNYGLQQYVNELNDRNKINVLKKNERMLESRKKFLLHPSIKNWVVSIYFLNFYTYKKEFLRDCYVAFKS